MRAPAARVGAVGRKPQEGTLPPWQGWLGLTTRTDLSWDIPHPPQPSKGLAGRTSPRLPPLVNKAAFMILRSPVSTSVCTTEGIVGLGSQGPGTLPKSHEVITDSLYNTFST